MSVSLAEAQSTLTQKLGLAADKAEKLVKTVQDPSGNVSKAQLDQLVSTTSSKIEQLRVELAAADKEKNGTITPEDANAIIAKHFPNMPEETRRAVVHNYDKENYGKVDAKELLDFYVVLYAKRESMERRFVELDTDNSGFLERVELHDLLKEEVMWPDMAYGLFDDFDNNKDGKIDKKEFVKVWTNMLS